MKDGSSILELTVADAWQDVERIERLKRVWPPYEKTVLLLPHIYHEVFEGEDDEVRLAAVNLLLKLLLVEVDDFLRARRTLQLWGPEATNRYGKILLVGVIAMMDAAQRVYKRVEATLPLNAYHETIRAIQDQEANLWRWAELGERMLRAASGLPAETDERGKIHTSVLGGLVLSRVKPEARELIKMVDALDPVGMARNSISTDTWEDVSRGFARRGLTVGTEACRKRYRDAMKQIREDADWVKAIIEKALSAPDD